MHEFKDSNKKVFLMSLPIFVELLLQLLVGNIDQVMLSHISQSDVAAIGNANQITNIIVIAMELLYLTHNTSVQMIQSVPMQYAMWL